MCGWNLSFLLYLKPALPLVLHLRHKFVLYFWFCFSLIVSASGFKPGLCLVRGGCRVFVAHPMLDKQDEFFRVLKVCVYSWQFWGPLITQHLVKSWMYSVSLSLTLCFSPPCTLHFVCVCVSLFLRCALTRFSPKLCLGPEWSLCFSHLPYHTSCTTIGGHNLFTKPSGGREHTQIQNDKDIHVG